MTTTLGDADQPTLSADDLAEVDGWWRAANYLSAAQIYLLANPLLREPLHLEHVRPDPPGHGGPPPRCPRPHTRQR